MIYKIVFLISLYFSIFESAKSQIDNSFEYQQKYVKQLVAEINTLRKNPKLFVKKYNCKALLEYRSAKQLIINDTISNECYRYAQYLGKIGKLEHSKKGIPCSESLSKNYHIDQIIRSLVEENNYNGDGHRKHITGNTKPFDKEKIIGIGFYFQIHHSL